MSMTNREVDSIINKIRNARTKCSELSKRDDIDKTLKDTAEFGDDVILDFIEAMCRYTDSVFEDKSKNIGITSLRESCNSQEEYQAKFEEIEKRRKSAHNNLITSIKVVDLVCRKIGVPEIYGKLPEKYKNNIGEVLKEENRGMPGVLDLRHDIANWTWDFVIGCIIDMNVELDPNVSNKKDYQNDIEAFESIQDGFESKKVEKMLEDLTEPEL